MKQTVNIRKETKQIKINFMYNVDLYDLMKKHNGWFLKKEKCWVFPLDKLDEIKKDIKGKHHTIKETISDGTETTKTENPFDTPDIVLVYGHCKICGNYCCMGKKGICLICLLKK
jgi:hypothetical protein